MSKTFSANRFHTAVSDWAGELVDPGVAGVVAPSGSLGLIGGGTTHEIYLKTGGAGAGGWCQENLVGLRVFNIEDYGAVGDNLTDNRVTILAAITACNAAGGGIVYIPPGEFVIERVAGAPGVYSFDLGDMHNITFLGDGHVSQLLMKGVLPNSTNWTMFRLHNQASNIKFLNLYIDANQVTIDILFGELIFPIQIQGATAIDNGANNVLIEDCFFGNPIGDVIRLLGNIGESVYDITIRHNILNCVDALDIPRARSGICFQRGVRSTMVDGNFMRGSHDQEIDFEPTVDAEVTDITITNNHYDHQDQALVAISIGGPSEAVPANDIVYSNNVMTNGGSTFCGNCRRLTAVGNIMITNFANSSVEALRLISLIEECVFSANVIYMLDTLVDRHAISLIPVAVVPPNNLFVDNVIRGERANNGVHFESCQQLQFVGNVLTMNPSGASPEGFRHRSVSETGDQISVVGNLIAPDSAVTNVVIFSASPMDTENVMCSGNYLKNYGAGTSINFAVGGGGLFTGNSARYTGDNLAIDGSAGLTVPAGGTTLIGPAGLGAQGNSFTATPAGAVSSPAGSFAVNTAGGDSVTLFQKESAVDATGWVGVGTYEVEFGVLDTGAATTALFMAPGSELAVAGATEIQFAMPRNGTIRNFRVVQVAGVGAGTITYTVRKNGANQTGPITINFIATTGGPSGSFTAVAGDLISVQITKSIAAGTNPTFAVVTLEIAG